MIIGKGIYSNKIWVKSLADKGKESLKQSTFVNFFLTAWRFLRIQFFIHFFLSFTSMFDSDLNIIRKATDVVAIHHHKKIINTIYKLKEYNLQ